MSINSAMLAGVSGLIANSSALAAISDNIANVNTVGYKRNQVSFTDMVTSQAVRTSYNAGGVQGTATSYVSQQGQVQSSTSSTDVALSGNGFFVVSGAASGPASTTREYTRAGSFDTDANGFLKNTAGLYLLGWPVGSDGTVDANPSDLTKLQPINIKNLASTVSASTTGQITANLDADQATSAGLATYNASTNSMTAYDATATPAVGTKPDYTIQMNVIDSQGGPHTINISVLKGSAPNTWNAEIYAVPASDLAAPAAGVPQGQIASGVLHFNSDGTLDTSSATTLFANAAAPSINIPWNASLGIASQSMAMNLTGAGGGLSQLAGASSVTTASSDGATVGNVTGVQIGADGMVTATFDNGQTRKLAQIAVASFANPDGLTGATGNAYTASIASGEVSLKKPGEAGAGTVDGGALEASTVDLSTEFTNLITTQRAYSASSKIITTADEMMQELLDTIR
jgi:flagellar hook protein FlgE